MITGQGYAHTKAFKIAGDKLKSKDLFTSVQILSTALRYSLKQYSNRLLCLRVLFWNYDQIPWQNNSELRGSFRLRVSGQSIPITMRKFSDRGARPHCVKSKQQVMHASWYTAHSTAQHPRQGLPISTNVIKISLKTCPLVNKLDNPS